MNAKWSGVLVAVTLAVIVSLLWVGSVSAQATEPTMDASGWMPMDGSHPHWFSFEVGRYEDQVVSHVGISVEGRPHNGAAFQVFAGGNYSYWGEPDPEEWFGMSTPGEDGGAGWAGELPPGAYFVRIADGGDKECMLGISGEAVHNIKMLDIQTDVPDTFVMAPEPAKIQPAPAVAAPAVAAAPPAAKPAMIEPAAVAQVLPATEPGFDFKYVEPAMAMAPEPAAPPAPVMAAPTMAAAPAPAPQPASMAMRPGEWMPVMDNDPHLFNFYVGRLEGEATVPVSVSFIAEPISAGRFMIFEAGKACCVWDTPEDGTWLGASYESDTGEITWSGDLPAGGYVVRVEGQGAKNCLLAVSGQTVVY